MTTKAKTRAKAKAGHRIDLENRLALPYEHRIIALARRPNGEWYGIIEKLYEAAQVTGGRPFVYYDSISRAGLCFSGSYQLSEQEAWSYFHSPF